MRKFVKKPMFPQPRSKLPPVSYPVVEMWTKPLSEFKSKYPGGIDCFFIYVYPSIVIMKSSVKVPLYSVRHL